MLQSIVEIWKGSNIMDVYGKALAPSDVLHGEKGANIAIVR